MDRFDDILKFLLLDLEEAFACDRMLVCLQVQLEEMEDEPAYRIAAIRRSSDEDRGIAFVQQTFFFRLALAVQRTLQPGRSEKASLSALLDASEPLIDANRHADLAEICERIRMSEDARRLHNCRNEYMAHSITSSINRYRGLNSKHTVDLLFRVAELTEEIHEAVKNRKVDAHYGFRRYQQIAESTWSTLMPLARRA